MTSNALDAKLSKEKRKKEKAAGKSFFDNADAVSEASTKAKNLAKVKLPKGKLTNKQYRRLNEMKLRTIYNYFKKAKTKFCKFSEKTENNGFFKNTLN